MIRFGDHMVSGKSSCLIVSFRRLLIENFGYSSCHGRGNWGFIRSKTYLGYVSRLRLLVFNTIRGMLKIMYCYNIVCHHTKYKLDSKAPYRDEPDAATTGTLHASFYIEVVKRRITWQPRFEGVWWALWEASGLDCWRRNSSIWMKSDDERSVDLVNLG